jgi:lysozyme
MTVISTASTDDVRFIAHHESPGGKAVSRAYRCPAGVITIGHGFTMGSKVFAAWWRAKHGRALQMGDTISQADADMLLKRLIDEEYGAAVAAKARPARQHQFGAASSMSFNCGPGALGWKWAAALARGDIAESARLLRTTAVTANGRRLAGLVRRRDEEATLLETGRYTVNGPAALPSAVSQTADEVREYQQQLISLGYDVGPAGADGISGKLTTAAVLKFQTDQQLVADGLVGPATRATLIRALDAKRGNQAVSGGAAAGGAGGAAVSDPSTIDVASSALFWGLAAVLVVGAVILFLKYRGVLTGRRVPT